MKVPAKWALLMALIFLVISASLVAAHAELVEAQPAPGETLAESPAEIRLTFSEAVGEGSEILLFAEGLQSVDGVESHTFPANPTVLAATLPALEAGSYTVQWTATSADGHEVSGTYSFAVGEAAADEHAAGEEHAEDHEHAAGDHAEVAEIPDPAPIWGQLAIALIGGALLVLLGQRFLRGP